MALAASSLSLSRLYDTALIEEGEEGAPTTGVYKGSVGLFGSRYAFTLFSLLYSTAVVFVFCFVSRARAFFSSLMLDL